MVLKASRNASQFVTAHVCNKLIVFVLLGGKLVFFLVVTLVGWLVCRDLSKEMLYYYTVRYSVVILLWWVCQLQR